MRNGRVVRRQTETGRGKRGLFLRVSFRQVFWAVALVSPLFGLAARPVARWDVVPDQSIGKPFEVGVCAFHRDGVGVVFFVNSNRVATVANPTLNPRTKVWEFWFALDPANYPDGKITLGARATSLAAAPESYELPPLVLYANAGGSLAVSAMVWADAANGQDANPGTEAAPKKTLAAAVGSVPAGGTVNLKPGVYSAQSLGGGTRPYWTTLQAAPGVARERVEIAGGRPSADHLKFKDVTLFIDAEKGYACVLGGDQGRTKVWLDNCLMTNKRGRWAADSFPFGNGYPAYVTGGVWRDMRNGTGGVLLRGLRIETIGSDAWTGGGKLVVNCVVDGIDPGATGSHPDFHQSHAVAPNWVSDVILYNVRGYRCRSQGLFGTRLRDAAFVNVEFQKEGGVFLSQYSGPMENVLFFHNTIIGQSWMWRNGYAPKDVVFMNNLLVNMGRQEGADTDPSNLSVSHNHFAQAEKTFGTDVSTGAPLFCDPSKDDYRLKTGSPAASGGVFLQCVPADIDGIPHDPKSRAKGAHATGK